MGNLWRLLEWIGLALGVVIAGMAMTFLLTRRRIMRHVERELGREVLLLATGARVGAYDHLADGEDRLGDGGAS